MKWRKVYENQYEKVSYLQLAKAYIAKKDPRSAVLTLQEALE